ncbi:hypothetical protein ABZV52_29845 [Streptomyces sp. NPDC004735]
MTDAATYDDVSHHEVGLNTSPAGNYPLPTRTLNLTMQSLES